MWRLYIPNKPYEALRGCVEALLHRGWSPDPFRTKVCSEGKKRNIVVLDLSALVSGSIGDFRIPKYQHRDVFSSIVKNKQQQKQLSNNNAHIHTLHRDLENVIGRNGLASHMIGNLFRLFVYQI